MTNDEMIVALLDDTNVQEAILAMSRRGALTEETLPSMIGQYHQLCGAFCTRLFEVNVQENPEVGKDNRVVPFITLGQPGNFMGPSDDVIFHLAKQAGVEVDNVEEYVTSQVTAGNEGTPNLVHGLLNADVLGTYLSELKVAQMVEMMMKEMPGDDVMGDVVPMFGGGVKH